jgi:hypothetical protein
VLECSYRLNKALAQFEGPIVCFRVPDLGRRLLGLNGVNAGEVVLLGGDLEESKCGSPGVRIGGEVEELPVHGDEYPVLRLSLSRERKRSSTSTTSMPIPSSSARNRCVASPTGRSQWARPPIRAATCSAPASMSSSEAKTVGRRKKLRIPPKCRSKLASIRSHARAQDGGPRSRRRSSHAPRQTGTHPLSCPPGRRTPSTA